MDGSAAIPHSASLNWQALRDNRRLRILLVLLGLALVVAGNQYLRQKLERHTLPPYAIFPDDRIPWGWQLLLPVDMGAGSELANQPGTYHWFTTGLTVVKIFEQVASRNTVYYWLNGALIIASFVCAWGMSRSLVFSFTMAIAMAFGTQFSWVHICSSITAFYLYVIYLEVNVVCLFKTLTTGTRRWRIAYVVSLIILALNHEQWLDYLTCLVLGCAFLWFFARKHGPDTLKPQVVFVLVSSLLIAAIYLGVRLQFGGQQHRPGDESEMIFAYQSRTLAAEDILCNVFTYLYVTLTNYVPPPFLSSNSLYRLGAERIIAEQHGYHEAKQHLVVMHHLFFWYFYAGAAFVIFIYFLFRNARLALREGSSRHVFLTLAMLLIATGFAIHGLIKFRPYNSVPLLAYKCLTGTVGVTFLIALLVKYGHEALSARRWTVPLAAPLVILCWGVLVYGGFSRPAYLSDLSKHVGLETLPDPMKPVHVHKARATPLPER